MQRRQDTVEATRLRITEATTRLHERVGPAATTVSGIAEEAGVTRLTVYRHFPDEVALISACATHWAALHPQPDPAAWAAIKDPEVRLRSALQATYAWARDAAPMMTKIHRDVEIMPPFVGELIATNRRARVAVLAAGFGVRDRGRRRLEAALAHALHIHTWVSLCSEGGLTDEEATDAMTAAVLAFTPKMRDAARTTA